MVFVEVVVNPNLKYKVVIYQNNWSLVEQWCAENVGEFDRDWYKLGIDPAAFFTDGRIESIWYFARETDATAFSLKWAF